MRRHISFWPGCRGDLRSSGLGEWSVQSAFEFAKPDALGELGAAEHARQPPLLRDGEAGCVSLVKLSQRIEGAIAGVDDGRLDDRLASA